MLDDHGQPLNNPRLRLGPQAGKLADPPRRDGQPGCLGGNPLLAGLSGHRRPLLPRPPCGDRHRRPPDKRGLDFARKHPTRIAAYKDASGRKASPYTKTVIDRYPGTKIPIPGGVELYVCDTHHYKDQLAAKLRIRPEDPGAYHFHKYTTEKFARHLCSEYVDDRRLRQCPKGKANHYWDCSVMELVAADLLQLKYLEKESVNG